MHKIIFAGNYFVCFYLSISTIFLQPSVDAVDCTHKYTVKKDDNCWNIAHSFGLNNADFMAFNGIPSDCRALPVSKFWGHFWYFLNAFLGRTSVRRKYQVCYGFEVRTILHVNTFIFLSNFRHQWGQSLYYQMGKD